MEDDRRKKRARIALSCDNCRKRKTKCDRSLPCTQCTKLSIPHLCVFSSPKHLNNKSSFLGHNADEVVLQDELNTLKMQMRKLESSLAASNSKRSPLVGNSEEEDGKSPKVKTEGESPSEYSTDLIKANKDLWLGENRHPVEFSNFFSSINKQKLKKPCGGPLPFLSIMKREAGARVVFWFQSRMKRSEYSTRDIFYNYSKSSPNKEMARIALKASQKYGINYVVQEGDGYSMQEVKQSMNNFGMSQGYVIYPHDTTGKSLNEKIAIFLPSIEVATKYLEYFFRVLYPFFPILDEEMFGSDVIRIIVNFSRVHSGPIFVEKQSDYATISTLLYLLRLCYISLFSNSNLDNEQMLASISPVSPLLQNPVPIDAAAVAEECLNTYNFLRKSDINVLQALMFSKYYDALAPELGSYFGDTRSHVSNGTLVQMALALGLHRDPDYVTEVPMNGKTKNLRRKIWHSIVLLDINNAITLGSPLSISTCKYDTCIPKEGNSNIRDHNLEHDVIKSFSIFQPLVERLVNFLTELGEISENIDITKFIAMVNDLELSVCRMFGRFGDFLKPNNIESDSFVIKKFGLYLLTKLLLGSVYGFFYVHHHDLKVIDLEYFYYRKLIALFFCELSDTSKVSVAKNLFGPAFSFMVAPLLNQCISIATSVAGSICVRVAITLAQESCDAERSSQLQSLYSLGLNCTNDGFNAIAECGQRYNSSWNMRKSYMYGFTLVFNSIGSEPGISQLKSSCFHYSNQQAIELSTILKFHLLRSNSNERQTTGAAEIVRAFSTLSEKDGNKMATPPEVLPPDMEEEMARELQVDNFWCQHYMLQNVHDPEAKKFLSCVHKNQKPESKDIIPVGETFGVSELSPFPNLGDFFGNNFSDIFEDPSFTFKFA